MHRLTQDLRVRTVPRPWAPVRLAVVGLGYWGPNLVRNLVELPEAELAYICDLRDDALSAVGRRYPAARCTTSFEEVLADPDVDGVAIATPVSTHYDLARTALEAGKHVLVEKPLAASSREGEELLEAAADRGLVLMAGHTFVYSPPVNVVYELIRSGELGEIYFISTSRVNLGLHQSDTSVAWDLGPHDFSILLHWLGERPETVRAVGRDSIVPGVADVAFVTLSFPSGIVAQVELSWLSPSKLRRTVVVGSEKMVVYEDGAPEAIRLFDHGVVYSDPETFGQYQLSYRTGDIIAPKLPTHEPLSVELADFARAIREGSEMPYHSLLARDVVAITEAASRSLDAGGELMRVDATAPLPLHGPVPLAAAGRAA
jgi:predicted dehydrogenase